MRAEELSGAHPGQEQVHLQLGHASAQTRPHAKPKRYRPERVLLGFLFSSSEPSFRLEDVGVGEDVLIVGHAVVAQVEERLWGGEISVRMRHRHSAGRTWRARWILGSDPCGCCDLDL